MNEPKESIDGMMDAKVAEPGQAMPDIPPDAAKLVESIKSTAVECFDRDGYCMAVMASIVNGEIEIVGFPQVDAKIKDMAGVMLQQKSESCDAVVFVCEAWCLRMDVGKDSALPGIRVPKPRHSPNRTEAVVLRLLIKDRQVLWMNPILRPENKLSGWVLQGDTAAGAQVQGENFDR